MNTDSRAPRTAAGRWLFSSLVEQAGKPNDRLLREQILAIEAEAAADPVAGEALREALERAERAERFIGGITADEWATIDKAREAATFAAPCTCHVRFPNCAVHATPFPSSGLDVEAGRLLRGMIESWDRMDPNVRGIGWPHEAWVNEARRMLARQEQER